MRKMFAVLGALAVFAVASPAMADVVLVEWNFEVNTPPDLTDSAASPPVTGEAGVYAASSLCSGLHAGTASDWSTPVGNGSPNSFSVNTWAVGDYWQFRTSTTDYQNITIRWDQASSNTGPRDFSLNYSLNGSTFTWLSDYSVLSTSTPVWSSATYHAEFQFGPIALPAALDNQASVYFRLVDRSTISANGGTVAASGTDRIDNVVISGTYIPEPATLALLAFGGLALLRRR